MTNIFRTRPKPDTSDGQSWIWCRFYYSNGDLQDALIPNTRVLWLWDAMLGKIQVDAIGLEFKPITVSMRGLDRVQVIGTIGTQRQTTGAKRAATIANANNRRTSRNQSQ